MDDESWVQNHFLSEHRSESKVLVGKRGSMEVEETSDKSQKRVKMRDLESVFRSEGREGSEALSLNVDVGSVDCMVGDNDPACIDESNNLPTSGKEDVQRLTKARGFDLDLNAADVSSSINDPCYPYKMSEQLRSRDDSDCGSSVGPLGKRDPMRVWKGLKQNNYISSPYGALPMGVPKARGRKKSNNDAMKKKIELAKKEQVDRFARVAAPSGLLNGLNPGIINHVRNSRQVHSIIEALVRSEREENLLSESKKYNQIKSGAEERTERKEAEDVRSSGVNTSTLGYEDALLVTRQMADYALFSKSVYPNMEVARGDNDSCVAYARSFSKVPSRSEKENEDDKLSLKLSSSVPFASQNASCLSNDESANFSSVTSLSLKAATVASQWLELLNQDIRGRLAALRRSKKRVGAVITTELPLLISREFSFNIEKDVHSADAHCVRWSALIEQMDKALSEEERHLENWLNQVKEMQLHCEMGLNKNSLYHASQQTGPTGDESRPTAMEKDIAVRAAAASIYSTCNFLLSMDNSRCC